MLNKNLNKLFLLIIVSFLSILSVFADNTGSTIINTGEQLTALPQIIINTWTNKIYISGYVNTWTTNTWIDNTLDEETDVVLINTGPIDLETEFSEALTWMYENWLTKYNNKDDYKMYDLVTRGEASKIIWQAYSILWYEDVTKSSNCDFSDLNSFDSTLIPYISNVCKWWLFKWYDGKYMPQDNLTKAQAMAVLLRMFEWKMSYELLIPWRGQYHIKGKLIWLTNVEDTSKFDTKLTRYEIGLMVYRLKNIATNTKTKNMALNLLGQVVNTNSTWTMNSETVIENLNTLVWWIDPYKDPELLEAIYRMFDNGLTMHNNPNEYKPFDTLNKAAAAKIFDKFSTMLWLSTNETLSSSQCQFTDLGDLSSVDKQYVVNVCKKWIMKWNNNLFSPNTNMNKSHFVASLIRMFEWKYLDESTNPWWQNYFNKAQELGIVSPSNIMTFETPITRYEVALFLYRFNVKYKMLNNLNNNRISNEIISTVVWSISTWTNWKIRANVYLDSTLLKKWSFNLWYIETFGTRYKIVKVSESSYFSDNFVRYGNIFDLASDEDLWTINFVVSNGYIVESTVRFNGWDKYSISPIEWTSAYYLMQTL